MPMVAMMDESAQQRVAEAAANLDDMQVLRLAKATSEADQWPELLTTLARVTEDRQAQMMEVISQLPASVLRNLPSGLDYPLATRLTAEA